MKQKTYNLGQIEPGEYQLEVISGGQLIQESKFTIPYQTVTRSDFLPDGGHHSIESLDVLIQCSISGAFIYYTIDGSEPQETSESVQPGEGETVTVPIPGQLKANAYKDGMTAVHL